MKKSALNKYEENRRYLEFHGNRFEVKPVAAYRANLRSEFVQRIHSIPLFVQWEIHLFFHHYSQVISK